MKQISLAWNYRVQLAQYMGKINERIARNEDNMANITFRVDLLNLQKCVEDILEHYKEETKGEY